MHVDREILIRRVLSAQLASAPTAQEVDAEVEHMLCTLLWMVAQSSEPVPRSREGVYRVCHALAKQYDIYPEMRSLMRVEWGAKSMRELSDTALRGLYHFMRALERHILNQTR